jgi:phosphoglucosamine mutase
MKLFGTDGVRGKAGKKISAELVMRLAMAAGIYFRKHSVTNKILVGKDTRRSGYMIENALVSGFTAVGYDVVQIGPMPTPAIAFITANMRCDAGIMISASHNPFGDNGIKFFDAHGDKLCTEAEAQIESIFLDSDLIEENQKIDMEIGASKRIDDVIGRYIVHIKNSFPKDMTLHGIRVVVDAANGAAYKVAPTVFRELGAETIVINGSPDGSNINKLCGAMHPEALAEEVKRSRADIGFALDGDADRLVVVDENGEVVDGDHLLGALSCYLLSEGRLKGGSVAATVMSNKALEDHLKGRGIGLDRSKVGDKYVLEIMKRDGLNFGGEQSGHVILSDFAKTGDGLVTALQCVSYLLKSEGKKASAIFRPFELMPQLQSHIMVNEKKPLDKIDGYKEMVERFEKEGIRVLFRYSGTEAKLRLLLEYSDEKKLQERMEEAVDFFKRRLA